MHRLLNLSQSVEWNFFSVNMKIKKKKKRIIENSKNLKVQKKKNYFSNFDVYQNMVI